MFLSEKSKILEPACQKRKSVEKPKNPLIHHKHVEKRRKLVQK